MFNRTFLRSAKRTYLNLKGIISNQHAYKGPDLVQVDLTDKCKSNCCFCWLHSPFLGEDVQRVFQDIDFTVLKCFLSDVVKSGASDIILSGGGEPFCYPDFWKVLEYAQKLRVKVHINTSLAFIGKADISKLLSFSSLSSVTVSAWGGESAIYSKLHNRDDKYFFRMKENLKYLTYLKHPRIYVKLSSIVTKLNYLGLVNLFELAVETRCDAIEFGVLDSISEATDIFLLDLYQLDFLSKNFIKIMREMQRKNSKIKVEGKSRFLRRINNPKAFQGEYDSFIENNRCFSGWTFLRMRANGDLNSCLKSHRIPIGNIYKNSFLELWNNMLQREFREQSLKLPKRKDYFKQIGNIQTEGIGCKRICDNLSLNSSILRMLQHIL